MLERGAVPTMGICVFVGGSAKQSGHSARTAFRKDDDALKVKLTFAEIMPATKVPWKLLPRFVQPRASPTKSSHPMTEPSELMCGKPGRIPESMTPTMTPIPCIRPRKSRDVRDSEVREAGRRVGAGDGADPGAVKRVDRFVGDVEAGAGRNQAPFAANGLDRDGSGDLLVLRHRRRPRDAPHGREGSAWDLGGEGVDVLVPVCDLPARRLDLGDELVVRLSARIRTLSPGSAAISGDASEAPIAATRRIDHVLRIASPPRIR